MAVVKDYLRENVLEPDSYLSGDALSPIVRTPLKPFAPEPEPKVQIAPARPAPQPKAPVHSVVEQPAGDYYSQLGAQESGNNPFAHSSSSSASGLYQFTLPTWRGVIAQHPELGLREQDIMNPEAQKLAIRAFTGDNAKVLQQHGIDQTPGNLYIMHFMGSGAGPRFLKAVAATPGAPAAAMFPKEAAANPTIFYDKGQPRSLQQVYALQTRRFGGGQVDTSAPTAKSAPVEGSVQYADAGNSMSDAAPELPPGIEPYRAPQAKTAATTQHPPGIEPYQPAGETSGGWLKDIITRPVQALAHPAEGGIDPVKMAIEAGKEFTSPVGERAKGVAAGLGEVATGVGEAIPGEIGKAAARGTQALEKVGTPFSRGVGYLAGSLLPFGATAKGMQLAGKAVTGMDLAEAPAALRALGNVGTGATAGGATGLATPTGKEDESERFVEKGTNLLTGAAAGVLPAVGVEAYHGIKGAPEAYRRITGRAAEEAGEELRKVTAEQAGKIVEQGKKAATHVAPEIERHEAIVSKAQNELDRIARSRLERGESIERLKRKMIPEIHEAVAQANKAELSVKDAALHVEQRMQEHAAAQEAADEIARSIKARPGADAATIGKEFQTATDKIAEKFDAERDKLSGIKQVVERAGTEPTVKTSDVLAEIANAEKQVANDSTKAVFGSLRRNLMTAVKDGDPLEAINLPQAHSLMKAARRAMNTRQMQVEAPGGGFAAADASEAAHFLGKITDKLRAAAETSHPDFAQAMKKYAELSRPLDIFESGALSKVIQRDTGPSQQFKMLQGDVLSHVIRQTEGGEPAIARLLQEQPELRDSLRLHYNQELRRGDPGKGVTADKLANFLTDNERGLKQSGLYDEFAAVKQQAEGAREAAKTAEKALGEAKVTAKTVEKTKAEALSELSDKQRKLEKLKGVEKRVESHLAGKEKPLKETATKSAKALDDLYKKKQTVEALERDTKRFQADLERLDLASLKDTKEVAGKAEKMFSRWHDEQLISLDDYNKVMDKVAKAQKVFDETKDKQALVKNLINIGLSTAVATTAATAGITHLRKFLPF